MHGLADRDIGGRSAGYGSPEVGGPLSPTRSMLLDCGRNVIHGVISLLYRIVLRSFPRVSSAYERKKREREKREIHPNDHSWSNSFSLRPKSRQFPCGLELDNDAERFERSLFSMVFRALPVNSQNQNETSIRRALARSLARWRLVSHKKIIVIGKKITDWLQPS